MELALDAVTSGYGGIPIVREVSLEVGTGEIVAIVGRNGVSKTTLIETVAGLLPVMAGDIAFRGEDVTRTDARDRPSLHRGGQGCDSRDAHARRACRPGGRAPVPRDIAGSGSLLAARVRTAASPIPLDAPVTRADS